MAKKLPDRCMTHEAMGARAEAERILLQVLDDVAWRHAKQRGEPELMRVRDVGNALSWFLGPVGLTDNIDDVIEVATKLLETEED